MSRQPRNQGQGQAQVAVPTPTSRQNEYFVPRDGIDREVISADICRYLGNNALVRPGHYENPQTNQVVQGYYITAYRNLTTAMIEDLKADSARWDSERRAQTSRNTSGVQYRYSETHQSRQNHGPTEGPYKADTYARESYESPGYPGTSAPGYSGAPDAYASPPPPPQQHQQHQPLQQHQQLQQHQPLQQLQPLQQHPQHPQHPQHQQHQPLQQHQPQQLQPIQQHQQHQHPPPPPPQQQHQQPPFIPAGGGAYGGGGYQPAHQSSAPDPRFSAPGSSMMRPPFQANPDAPYVGTGANLPQSGFPASNDPYISRLGTSAPQQPVYAAAPPQQHAYPEASPSYQQFHGQAPAGAGQSFQPMQSHDPFYGRASPAGQVGQQPQKGYAGQGQQYDEPSHSRSSAVPVSTPTPPAASSNRRVDRESDRHNRPPRR
ncbi:hypothetical protein RJ55_05923 [Drechmeria coniospora]|nr:hypothetical protein RJ55_05923 [Drechmeria coniospora]